MTTTFDEAIKEYNQRQDEKREQELTPISISEALRKQGGRHTVQGIIVSRSDIYNLITKTKVSCNNCHESTEHKHKRPEHSINETKYRKCSACGDMDLEITHEYLSAVTSWIQDVEPKSELERLPVVLFEKDNENIGTGELVTVTGQIHIVHRGNSKQSQLVPILHAESIRYENREELTLTSEDKAAIEKFAGYPNLEQRLTSMAALRVVGHEIPKQGTVLSSVNTQERDDRLNILFAGDPGEAKTLLQKESLRLIPNSKQVRAQYASGKSMTAIVDKEGESYVLKLGPVVMAKRAFCIVNELGKLTFEDQSYLLDVLQEGEFNLNKHGFDKAIDAPTTIIASLNPFGGKFENDTISNADLPMQTPLRDRFDLLFVFKRDRSEETNREFANEKARRARMQHRFNYNFLQKYIHYAKGLQPELSDEATHILNEHWVQIATQVDFDSKRILDTLYKLTKSYARLRLKNVADVDEAKAAIEFYNGILKQYGRNLYTPADPRDLTIQEIRKLVSSMQAPIEFYEALKMIIETNESIKAYLLPTKKHRLKGEGNKRVRNIYAMIKDNPGDNIIITSMKPLVLKRSDGSYRSDTHETADPPRSDRSDERSDKSSSNDPNDLSDHVTEGQT